MEKQTKFYRFTFEFYESDGLRYEVENAEWVNTSAAYIDAIIQAGEKGADIVTVYQYDTRDTCGSYHEIGRLCL